MEYLHRPVLLKEVVHALMGRPDGCYVDGTAGCGGHSEAIAGSLGEKGRLICLDRDREAVRLTAQRLAPFGTMVQVLKASFVDMVEILSAMGEGEVDGVLLDLGISSHQIECSGRGFSFSREELLDMRMDQDDPVTAMHLVNTLSMRELERILRMYGEERRAKRIARVLTEERERQPIESALRLAQIIREVVPRSGRPGEKHPATRAFQALRIAVNRELENLDAFLRKVPALVRRGGRIVILSYHSLEDRAVKQTMAGWEKGCDCPPDFPRCACGKKPLFRRLSKKGIRPSRQEVQDNPRARSATLRAAERI